MSTRMLNCITMHDGKMQSQRFQFTLLGTTLELED